MQWLPAFCPAPDMRHIRLLGKRTSSTAVMSVFVTLSQQDVKMFYTLNINYKLSEFMVI